MTKEWRVYGLTEDALGHRLAALCADPSVEVALSVYEGHGTVTLTAPEEAMEPLSAEVASALCGYVYSETGETLAAAVVRLLTAHGLTVATAESCTGGLIAAALTDVAGASRVFGTGVVSYSNDCKNALLGVAAETLDTLGAVSAATAGQMARGVRQTAAARLGVSVTGEAGPVASEAHPVGTVFIALADKKRTWVEELHLEGERAAIRRQAADRVLWLLWRCLSAYPAVMAGGESHQATTVRREIPRTQGVKHPRLLSRLLPWRGDSRRRLLVKCTVWLAVLAVLAGCVWAVYHTLSDPTRNRELQDSLGEVYWSEPTDLTDGAAQTEGYPAGMMPVFRGLYQMNEDVAGWIHIPDSGIDYPVMQYADGYYRNHNFAKQYSIYGQPYFDELHSAERSQMMVIHGRNTGNDQMFSELLNYRRVAYLREHPVIEMNTLTAKAQWQIFAVCVRDTRDEDHFNLEEQPKDYGAFVESLLRRSLFLSDVTVTEEDTLLLLTVNAQNEYGFNGAQLVVAARRVEGEPMEATYGVNYRAEMPAAMAGNRSTTRTTRSTTERADVTTTVDGLGDPHVTESTTGITGGSDAIGTTATQTPSGGEGGDDTTTENDGTAEDPTEDSTTVTTDQGGDTPTTESTAAQEDPDSSEQEKDSD